MQLVTGPDSFAFRSPHGMRAASGRLRTFAGISVRHLQHFNHPGRAWHDLSGPEHTLTIVLAEIGGRCEARSTLHRPAALDRQRPHHISYIPADLRAWGYADHIASVRELRLSFDHAALAALLGPDLAPGRIDTPNLMFHDPRALACARLLAAECDSPHPAPASYGEGLVTALLSACLAQPLPHSRPGLSPTQQRLVLDYLNDHLEASVPVPHLARLVDLSPSQFTRSFKASTGLSPHRYQLNARIGRAQQLLLQPDESLSMVAIATGFTDQSHLTRVFRSVTGSTPHQWRRQQRTSSRSLAS